MGKKNLCIFTKRLYKNVLNTSILNSYKRKLPTLPSVVEWILTVDMIQQWEQVSDSYMQ